MSENIEKISELSASEEEIPLFRNILDKHLNNYKERCFKNGISAVNTFYRKEENGHWKIFLIISAHNLNYKNYWTGEWLSWWEVENVGGSNYTLKGTVKASTYYYEEGNIQFNLKSDFDEKLSNENEDELLAKDIIGIIESRENKIQVDLDQVYDNFSDNYIKPLRRKLPVTGNKMNWSLNQIGLK